MDPDSIHEINLQVELLYKFHVKNLEFKRRQGATIKIAVLASGRDNAQLKCFMTAVDICANMHRLEKPEYDFITTERVRMEFETPTDLIDRVLEADIHFVLGHIHQNVIELTEWSAEELYSEFKRLHYHPGWPWGIQLDCPVLTQDKYDYLTRFCSWTKGELTTVDTNPTFKLPLRGLKLREATPEELELWTCVTCAFRNKNHLEQCENCNIVRRKRKMAKPKDSVASSTKVMSEYPITDLEKAELSDWCLCHEEGAGWIVKGPYTTNKKCRRFAPTLHEVFHSIDIISRKYGPDDERQHAIIPYVMIQPCMANRLEYKAVVLNGKALHVKPTGEGKSFGDKKSRLKFAEDAVRLLKENCPAALLDGLVRVDFFENAKGLWVVNEFESLEARYESTAENDVIVEDFLIQYWCRYIMQFVYPPR